MNNEALLINSFLNHCGCLWLNSAVCSIEWSLSNAVRLRRLSENIQGQIILQNNWLRLGILHHYIMYGILPLIRKFWIFFSKQSKSLNALNWMFKSECNVFDFSYKEKI